MANTDFSLPEGTHTVALGLGDLNGILRGKRIPASHWKTICKGGNAFSVSLFSMDMTCDIWDSPYVSFDTGFADFHMFPMTKPVALPWEPGVAMCFARAEGMDHAPIPIDPRQVLVRQIERAAHMGIEVKVGPELEFFLLDPDTKLPRDTGIGVYGLDRAAELEHVIGPIRTEINQAGIPIEQSNPEYAAGQVEVNIRYSAALEAADRVVMFRSLVKQLAQKHGYLASFMPKPFHDAAGSGFHCHYSLWRDGRNMFADGGQLSDTGRFFVGGMQQRMAETALCGSPTPNGFRRREVNSFCPTNASWGIDNRTVGLRVIEGSDSATRIEKRDAGADANPYFLMAADIAAGLDGIEGHMEPGPVSTGNAYKDAEAPPIPTTIRTAIELARGSDWLQGVMGDDQYEMMVQQSEREEAFFAKQVTQVELDRYLGNF